MYYWGNPKEQHSGLNVLPWSDDRHAHHRATALINARLNECFQADSNLDPFRGTIANCCSYLGFLTALRENAVLPHSSLSEESLLWIGYSSSRSAPYVWIKRPQHAPL